MGLSDHERKVLAEMEAALEQEDPKLLSTLTGKARTKQSSRALLGTAVLLIGLLLLITALVAKATLIGVAAFLVSLTGLILIITNLSVRANRSGGSKKAKKPGWGSSLNERWDRRNEQQ
ncbi:MAG: DUF3040 domain-containing protein [Actinobacteria bacterium]|uniref:Unannotated protein n=1 Tax=freshwater metagenome TaxID=449393 RepID=A0A6J6GVF8_9ZZZZ|nr:DUF3040 domain-containing protein [Actinomycetota bacterium]MSY64487.1 DUF3040 domain-containing protein [Actinomycetota bacterium]MSZ53891.1 DUF3040 domain-containing protein [Actinomycetota bacterium]